ncbi:ATP-binding protein [Chroococcidiopsis sp. CCNUC1]|jgi:predicted kinase|uniref:AAA family ATPase n=1 Tax=Chroococcidiopsis sp. CCNUC1 TaxID=2653189 RepID=UPI0021132C1A|nr:ATP-binding protein [Chroococcidiopsis sp. CCNUC1]
MDEMQGTLIFFCGKMGSGKSTKAMELAHESDVILLSEDEWLSALYPEEIQVFDDYLKYSARLKPLLKKHVQNLLNSGITVVMDFPGNTPTQRAWFKEIFSDSDIPHKLYYLEASDELCLKQLERRRKIDPSRADFDTEMVFHEVNSYFQPPTESEGFELQIVRRENT